MKNDFRKERIFERKQLDAIGKCRIGTNYSANQFQMPGNNEMIHSTTCNRPQYTTKKNHDTVVLPKGVFFTSFLRWMYN